MRLALAFALTLVSLPPSAWATDTPAVLVYQLVTGQKGRIPLDTVRDCETIRDIAVEVMHGTLRAKCEVVR